MDSKTLEYLIKFSSGLEKVFPEKSAYWHLQELRRVMNVMFDDLQDKQ